MKRDKGATDAIGEPSLMSDVCALCGMTRFEHRKQPTHAFGSCTGNGGGPHRFGKLDVRTCEALNRSSDDLPARPECSTETQESVSTWAANTFGPAISNVRVAIRANEEMAELLRALASDDESVKAPREAADVLIVLYVLATRLGVDLHEEVDRKMAINRARKWALDGTGHGYHVRDESSEKSSHPEPRSNDASAEEWTTNDDLNADEHNGAPVIPYVATRAVPAPEAYAPCGACGAGGSTPRGVYHIATRTACDDGAACLARQRAPRTQEATPMQPKFAPGSFELGPDSDNAHAIDSRDLALDEIRHIGRSRT